MIALISCSSLKTEYAAPAKDLYRGHMFLMAKKIIEHKKYPWFILSAKHGLLKPDDFIEPYNLSLKSMTKNQREKWAYCVNQKLKIINNKNEKILVFAGELYLNAVQGFEVINPIKGLSLGYKMQRLKKILEELECK